MAEPTINRERMATLDNILHAAFIAGVQHGVGYEAFEAIPTWETEIQFRAWQDHTAGRTWDQERWRTAREAAQARERIWQAETEAGLR